MDDVSESDARRSHALLFVLGFSIIFLALGAAPRHWVLLYYRGWLSRVGGVLIIVFGLYLLGVLKIGAFMRERRVHLADKPLGYLGTLLVGMTFGAGWTPCIGPILGSILTYAASSADMSRGLSLLLAYSLGLAIPFLLSAVAIERFLDFFTKMKRRDGLDHAHIGRAHDRRGNPDGDELLHGSRVDLEPIHARGARGAVSRSERRLAAASGLVP